MHLSSFANLQAALQQSYTAEQQAWCSAGATITMVQAPSYSRQECYYGYQWPADIGCRVFLGFLLFEMGLQALGCQALRQLTAFLHHVGFAVLAVYCIHYSLLPLPFAWLVFGEASTIFLNFRWAQQVAGHASMTASCFVCHLPA